MKKITTLLCGATLILGVTGSANADLLINGSVWQGITDADDEVRLFDTTASAATATFSIDGAFNFDSREDGVDPITYGNFLDGGFDTNTVTWLTGINLDAVSMDTATGFAGSFFQFTGTAYFDANTVVTHDDGFWLTLNSLSDGSLVYEGGYDDPIAPTTTVLTNAGGNYSFVLNYIESNRLPAVLKMNVASVPEPALMLLCSTGLLGLAGIARRKKK